MRGNHFHCGWWIIWEAGIVSRPLQIEEAVGGGQKHYVFTQIVWLLFQEVLFIIVIAIIRILLKKWNIFFYFVISRVLSRKWVYHLKKTRDHHWSEKRYFFPPIKASKVGSSDNLYLDIKNTLNLKVNDEGLMEQ